MGIINITPDSFSDGGSYQDTDQAVANARLMIKDGAQIIDIGGESTRPGYDAVSAEEELERILPVVRELKNDGTLLSVDTQKAWVAQHAIEAGAHIINNVSAISNTEMAPLAARLGCFLILTANHTDKEVSNIITDTESSLETLLQYTLECGVAKEKIILDVGLGFGKTAEQNICLIKHLRKFREFGYPLLIGASRKRFIGLYSGEEKASNRLGGSLACAIAAWSNGADILRVHDVAATAQALKMTAAINGL